MCKCGCNICEVDSKTFLLNENVARKSILSEGLKHHLDKDKPLTEHLYRAGSRSYFDLWSEARYMYSRGILEFNHEDDLAILTETDLGHYGMYEGKKVPLDFIFEEDINILPQNELEVDFGIHKKDGVAFIIISHGSRKAGTLRLAPDEVSKTKVWSVEGITVLPEYRGKKQDGENGETYKISHLLYQISSQLDKPIYSDSSQSPGAKKAWGELVALNLATKEGDRYKMLPIKENDPQDGKAGQYGSGYGKINEKKAKKKKKKNPPLNKPKRGGSKAYYVYVKDPKTKNIKKVSFGSGGLKAKINNSKARQAFAKRHKCSTKKDKTKAGYWSCRLPRYAKLLGLKSNFTGFW